MKKLILILFITAVIFTANALNAFAGEMDVLVNKLVEKGILTPYEAQIILAEAKQEAAKELAKGKAVTAPSWTQKIKIKGDARFRTQVNWDKNRGPAHERIRNRVRARLGVEGKVNDQIKAGILAVTGGNDPRSTNQTLDDNFETQDFRLDAYYINWTPELPSEVGTGEVWVGKFKNPLKKTALLWDGDIMPAGMAGQYMSPSFDLGEIPVNLYGNTGLLWVDELSTSQNDPILYVFQGGAIMEINKDWDAKLHAGVAYYDFAHMKNNQNFSNIGSSGTNTYWTGNLAGSHMYDYNLVDVMLNYDAKRLFDYEVGNGLYADFIWNADSGANKDFAWMIGGYLGKKKPKKPGQWKTFCEYRYLERDAVPDFMPDSDFAGFTNSGALSEGGTNGQGIVAGVKYAILKNTVIGAKYYYCWPIDTQSTLANHQDEPSHLLQLDVATKF